MEENKEIIEKEENTEIINNTPNKSNKALVIVLVIILALLISFSLYYFLIYKKDDNDSNKDNPVVDNGNVVNVEKMLKEFPYDVMIADYQDNGNNISDEALLYLTYIVFEHFYNSTGEDYYTDSEYIEELGIDLDKISGKEVYIGGGAIPRMIDGKEFRNKMIEIFGKDNDMFKNSFYKDNIIFVTCAGLSTWYDKKTDKIIFHSTGACTGNSRIDTLVSNIDKEGSVYRVDVISGYFQSEEKIKDGVTNYIYNLYDKENGKLIKKNLSEDEVFGEELKKLLSQHKDRLNNYEFTFKKIDDNYQYQSMKMIKNESKVKEYEDLETTVLEDYTLSNTDVINKNILKYRYSVIVNDKVKYEDFRKYNIVDRVVSGINSTINVGCGDDKTVSHIDDIYDKNGVKYPDYCGDYANSCAENIAKDFGLTVDEISKMDKNVWSTSGGDYCFYMDDAKEIKDKYPDIYNDFFGSSFSIIDSYNYFPIWYGYDKNLEKIISMRHGGVAAFYERVIVETKEEKNLYTVKFVEGYYSIDTSDENLGTGYGLYVEPNSDDKINVIYTFGDSSIYKDVLIENKDKLNNYEVTFEKTDTGYKFKSIEKM